MGRVEIMHGCEGTLKNELQSIRKPSPQDPFITQKSDSSEKVASAWMSFSLLIHGGNFLPYDGHGEKILTQ